MLGDPLAHSLRQHLQEFIVVLAGAPALPRRFARHHFSHDLHLAPPPLRSAVRGGVGTLCSALGAPSPRFPPAPVLPRPSAPPLASFRNPLSGTLWVFHALNPVCHPPSACLPGWVVLA